MPSYKMLRQKNVSLQKALIYEYKKIFRHDHAAGMDTTSCIRMHKSKFHSELHTYFLLVFSLDYPTLGMVTIAAIIDLPQQLNLALENENN